MKKFAVFDIDGTLFRWQLLHSVVFELIESGHISASAKKTIDEKMQQWRNRTHRHAFRDYESTIIEVFLGSVGKLRNGEVETVADKILQQSGAEVYTYTRDLIGELRDQGYVLIAISGSQDEIVQRFAKLWQFDIALGQTYNKDGKVKDDTVLANKIFKRKGEFLKQIVKDNGLDWKDSVAVGDSHGDAQMLELVERPIAFNPDANLFEDAVTNHWPIVIERKNMIYRLEPHGSSYILV